ncbi:hypothetical protein IVA94_31990 [Bradyrhizobium sp. 156]|uniref:hypothetical protein n=1 Tax=unclassified Bradyrhizobium TaxID=2631580 RepID=UPI001FF73377|nr:MULTISPECIES: hypothetical protein [unclassified Bradyrhizobium]MCK1325407.1 hypothetical protein [Bradyrhizobium sp. 156]MCK1413559.1 hypothetical protein [Bradyrhizobium sp. CW4]
MSNDNKGNQGPPGGHNEDVTLEIATPNGVFRGTFDKNSKIEDVIKTVVEDRKLSAGDAFELFSGEAQLTPIQRPLVSFGLSGTVKLTLVAAGSGV